LHCGWQGAANINIDSHDSTTDGKTVPSFKYLGLFNANDVDSSNMKRTFF